MASTLSRLDSLGLYLGGHLRPLVYAAPVDNEEARHHSIADACQAVCNNLVIFERMRRFMLRSVVACTKFHGEHLLQTYSFSCSS
jgi:hypothetical protein